LHDRMKAYRAGADDPELSRIEREHGRLPSSRRQLHRILAGQTAASQMNGH
jgi:cell wall assembly regulator SMI1